MYKVIIRNLTFEAPTIGEVSKLVRAVQKHASAASKALESLSLVLPKDSTTVRYINGPAIAKWLTLYPSDAHFRLTNAERVEFGTDREAAATKRLIGLGYALNDQGEWTLTNATT